MLFDQRERERVVSGGNRRVRREHRRFAYFVQRGVERLAVFAQVANALQHDEAGVAFVEMKHCRLGAERFEGADTADSENDFLLDAGFRVATVQACGQLSVPRRVFFQVGVEQVERHAAQPDSPDCGQHRSIAERHRRDTRLAVRRHRRFDRRIRPVEALVALFLPPFCRNMLVKITLRIHEPDADQRHAEVARFLAVIAGQHTKAAGVNRQRLVQGEFGREVGNRLAVQSWKGVRPPGVARGARIVERGNRPIVEPHDFRIGCGRVDRLT